MTNKLALFLATKSIRCSSPFLGLNILSNHIQTTNQAKGDQAKVSIKSIREHLIEIQQA